MIFGRFGTRRVRGREIEPDEIFLDSSNLPQMNAQQFEGRVERPVSGRAISMVGVLFILVGLIFTGRAYSLQVKNGDVYADISYNNRVDRSVVFSSRGIIYDRNGIELAWNEVPLTATTTATTTESFATREYISDSGFSHLLGFVRYPKADAGGSWWREEYSGVAGAEKLFDTVLAGENGSILEETDARGKLVREDIVDPPKEGQSIKLAIDSTVQKELMKILTEHAANNGFKGGAGVIMDVRSGEVLSLVSFPEYDNNAFSDGDSNAITSANTNEKTPLLNRAIGGLYAPGSIVKPIFAAAALEEGIISPEKQILSTGAISLPNPYNPDLPSVFKDWKAHGYVDMRHAIAVSSDVYFYAIGGGYQDQKGLGIKRIDDYARRFGLGSVTGIALGGEPVGTIPTPEWKEEVFGKDDPWRIGNTYHTAIGQYGFQVTPLQVVRFTAAIANGGKLITPQLLLGAKSDTTPIGVSNDHLQIIREGMRMAVHSEYADRTERALDIGGIEIAGKTGTAQIGAHNEYMNSWAIGFWPYENPKYAFAVVLERAPAGTNSGAAPALSRFFYWLLENRPEYVK